MERIPVTGLLVSVSTDSGDQTRPIVGAEFPDDIPSNGVGYLLYANAHGRVLRVEDLVQQHGARKVIVFEAPR